MIYGNRNSYVRVNEEDNYFLSRQQCFILKNPHRIRHLVLIFYSYKKRLVQDLSQSLFITNNSKTVRFPAFQSVYRAGRLGR